MINIAIIGGGASGMLAAYIAARNGCTVTVMERLNRVGKKLLATGNGRCNLTNKNAPECVSGKLLHYHGENPDFALFALQMLDVNKTISLFEGMNLLTVFEGDKCFPYSLQASTVLDVLRFRCERSGVRFITDCEVKTVDYKKNKYIINGEKFDRCIVAAGGKASPHLGSNGSGYKLLEAFGHSCTKLYPAITQIKTETSLVKQLKGIKCEATASIFVEKKRVRVESGQLLFTDYGLSGPPILQLAGIAAVNYGNSYISLDLMPDISFDDLCGILNEIVKNPYKNELCAGEILSPIMQKRLAQVVVKYCEIKHDLPAKKADLRLIAGAVKAFKLKVCGVQGFDNAQVTAGGIRTAEFDDKTMQSKLSKGLYACGEILDIDGDCGGYNLQWAFSSGYLAGKSASEDI